MLVLTPKNNPRVLSELKLVASRISPTTNITSFDYYLYNNYSIVNLLLQQCGISISDLLTKF